MSSKKYEEIYEYLEKLSEEEFFLMVEKANKNIDLENSLFVELNGVYSMKSILNGSVESFTDLYILNQLIKVA